MFKKISFFIFSSLLGIKVMAAVGAGPAGSFIRNQNTLQSGATYYVSSGTVTNLNTTTLKFNDGTTMTTAASGSGGGGSSTLGVFKNGVQIASPTAQINFSGSYWGVTLGGTSTGTITLQEGNTSYMQPRNTLQFGTTVYPSFLYVGSSASITGGNGMSVNYGASIGSITVTSLSTNKMVATDSSSKFWSKGSISLSTEVAGIIPSANLPPSTTVYILNSNSLTTGTTAYADFLRSRTVAVFQSTAIALNGTFNGTVSGASFATFPLKGTTLVKSKTTMANLDFYPSIEYINPANLSVWNDANNDSSKSIAEFGYEYDDGFIISNNVVVQINRNAVTIGTGIPLVSSSGTITDLNTTTLKFNDGTTMTTASSGGSSSSSSFTYTFNAAQANLPGANAPYISNSTNAASAGVFFDESSTQTVTWATILNGYKGGTLYSDVVFTSSATTGTMNWSTYIECKTTNVDALDYDTDSFSTINSTSVTVGATSGMAMKATVALTNQDSCADGDTVRIKLERTAGTNDTAVGKGRVRFLRLYE